MFRLDWGKSRDHEVGLDRGVIFLPNGPIPWYGLSSVTQNPSDQREITRYRDGVKVQNRRSEDSFAATVEAFTYPESLTPRTVFGFSYRVKTERGYRIHLVYNARAKLSSHTYQQRETDPFSLDISTTPVQIPGAKSAAHLVIDTDKTLPRVVAAVEDVLYGNESFPARLPLPEELLDIFSIIKVIDNGDGTFTVIGPDDLIEMLDPTTFEITWPSAIYVDEYTYTIQ